MSGILFFPAEKTDEFPSAIDNSKRDVSYKRAGRTTVVAAGLVLLLVGHIEGTSGV